MSTKKEKHFLDNTYSTKEDTVSGEIILTPLYATSCQDYISIIVDEALEEDLEDNLCCQLRGKAEEDDLPSLYLHMNKHTYKVLIEGYWKLWGQ